MAKPLILFAFWDVMAGIYAHHAPGSMKLIWTTKEAAAIEGAAEKMGKLCTDEMDSEILVKHIRVLKPKIGAILSEEKALKVFLERFGQFAILGVEAKYFAHTIRPHYRNKLAHMYSPKLSGGTYSLQPRPTSFDEIMHIVANYPEPVVRREDGIDRIDGVAMLRDAEQLSDALIQEIQNSFTESQAASALTWLGIIDQQVEEF